MEVKEKSVAANKDFYLSWSFHSEVFVSQVLHLYKTSLSEMEVLFQSERYVVMP